MFLSLYLFIFSIITILSIIFIVVVRELKKELNSIKENEKIYKEEINKKLDSLKNHEKKYKEEINIKLDSIKKHDVNNAKEQMLYLEKLFKILERSNPKIFKEINEEINNNIVPFKHKS